jgi:hypothetical protein
MAKSKRINNNLQNTNPNKNRGWTQVLQMDRLYLKGPYNTCHKDVPNINITCAFYIIIFLSVSWTLLHVN